MATEARKRAVKKYDEANTKQVHLKLNLKTDADILEHLANVGNVQGYIKELIRADIEDYKSRVAYEQHTYEVAKTLEGLKIPLIDGYENKEAIDIAVKESHNLYIGWYEDYEYRIDTDTKTVLTVRKRL